MKALIYNLIHLTGVFAVLLAYGMLIGRGLLSSEDRRYRKFGAITSGIGLFLILLGGFGMIATNWQNQWFTWTWIKLICWVLLGGMIALINRKPQLGKVWYAVTLLIGVVALWAVLFKPGI